MTLLVPPSLVTKKKDKYNLGEISVGKWGSEEVRQVLTVA